MEVGIGGYGGETGAAMAGRLLSFCCVSLALSLLLPAFTQRFFSLSGPADATTAGNSQYPLGRSAAAEWVSVGDHWSATLPCGRLRVGGPLTYVTSLLVKGADHSRVDNILLNIKMANFVSEKAYVRFCLFLVKIVKGDKYNLKLRLT